MYNRYIPPNASAIHWTFCSRVFKCFSITPSVMIN
jgi:hypothetical protein